MAAILGRKQFWPTQQSKTVHPCPPIPTLMPICDTDQCRHSNPHAYALLLYLFPFPAIHLFQSEANQPLSSAAVSSSFCLLAALPPGPFFLIAITMPLFPSAVASTKESLILIKRIRAEHNLIPGHCQMPHSLHTISEEFPGFDGLWPRRLPEIAAGRRAYCR
jgi:hypothetical protein